ncbi:MAG: sulfoxide reductase heme-binding subunit YedZ [Gammaproteobacteria bacterium]|nr:sulfoxide reductase heme-binding subunit YedZ [Gammaproteobacteria bacterium]
MVARLGASSGRLLKPALFAACLVPLAALAWALYVDRLGANPIDEIADRTGEWTLRLLLVTLAVTPVRRLTGWRWPMRLRRMLGLFAFFYASLHFTTYIALDQFFLWGEILRDVIKRPFITVGFTAFVLLIPLAATSTKGMMRRLGRHWRRLHRLVYVIALLGVMHYLWLVKADLRTPLIYATLLALLMLLRLPRRAPAGRAPAPGLAIRPQRN